MEQPYKGSRTALGPSPDEGNEEGAGLIANAADNPSSRPPYTHVSHDYEAEPYESDIGYRGAMSSQRLASPGPITYPASLQQQQHSAPHQPPPPPAAVHALSVDAYHQVPPPTGRHPGIASSIYPDLGELSSPASRRPGVASSIYPEEVPEERDDTQSTVGRALWGNNPHQHKDGPMI